MRIFAGAAAIDHGSGIDRDARRRLRAQEGGESGKRMRVRLSARYDLLCERRWFEILREAGRRSELSVSVTSCA